MISGLSIKLKIKLIISGLLLILSFFSIFYIVVSFPFGILMITRFEVRNETAGTIEITPYGLYEGVNESGPLPIYLTKFPAIQSPFLANLKIKPKETRRILFDSDDTQLSGIIILNNSGEFKQLAVKFENRFNDFSINDTTRLEPVDEKLIQITKDNHYLRFAIFHLLLLVGLINIPIFFSALKAIP